MTPFSLSGLLAGVTSFAFGLLVYWKSSDRKLARMWSLFSISAAVWGFGGFWIGFIQDPVRGLFAWRVTYALGVIWIAPLFYHFVRTFLGRPFSPLVPINYLLGLLFLLAIPTRLFFQQSDFLFGQFCYARGGRIYPLYFAWWISLVIISHLELIRASKQVSSLKRSQIQYFLLAIAVGFVGGSLSYLPNFNIDVYPWGNFSVMFYPILMTYAILKYNLMDIRIFIRRAGLVVAVYSVLLLIVIPLLFIFHKRTINTGSISIGFLGVEVILLSGILSAGPALYAYFVRRSSFFHEHTMAGITHELKSPLAVIEGAMEMLSSGVRTGASDAHQAPYVEMIERNISRLKGFINDLLQVYRIHDKKISLEMKEEDLSAIGRRVVNSRTELAKQKGIQITLLADESPLKIICDGEKIEQVISNLLSNAIKFTDHGYIEVLIDGDADFVSVKITDSGVGISSMDLPYVFDRFFQGSVNKSSRGSGIGLAIAKTWTEAHGGEIHAASDGPGKGSQFWLRIPKR